MLIREITESSANPKAVFVLGAAAQGKSSAAEDVIEDEFGYTLVDVDRPADALRKQYGISDVIDAPSEADKARQKEIAALRKAGKLPPAPKMADFDDPEDYIKAMDPADLKPHHAAIAGGEISKRHARAAQDSRENLVFVETGGKAGYDKRIAELKDAGYDVYAIFVGIYPDVDLSNPDNLQKVLDITVERQKQRARQLDPEILRKALAVSQKTKEKVLPLFDKVGTVDSGKLNQEQAREKTRQIMKGWGL